MYTFQDLEKLGENDTARAQFVFDAIDAFKTDASYLEAREGEEYFHKHNTTIENFEKWLYTISGDKIPDLISANHKLKTLFFHRLVVQQVQYVLGNGVTLGDAGNKEKLGKDFDHQVQTAAKRALAGGVAFGFWNYDHVEVFGYADTRREPGFCPLKDDYTAQLRAGIRYWYRTAGDEIITNAYLYEEDGFTIYSRRGTEDPVIVKAKQGYKRRVVSTVAGGVEEIVEENYGRLPIVPFYANESHESELVGIKESIDCYDLIKSGLANAIDDTPDIYWLVKNASGMQDNDIALLLERLRTMHGVGTDGDGDEVVPVTVAVPTEARKLMLELLRKDIYEDFQALDVTELSANAKTATEIDAAYQPMDNKCADFEYYVIDFVQKILELAGINDNPTLVWNKVVNQTEQTQMVIDASPYLDDKTIVKKLPFLTPEEADAVIEAREAKEYTSFNRTNKNPNSGGNIDEFDEEDEE